MMDRELDTAASEPVQPQGRSMRDCSQGAPRCAEPDEHGVTPAAGQDWRPPSPQEGAEMEEAFGGGASELLDDYDRTLEADNEIESGDEVDEAAAALGAAVPLRSSLPDLSKAAGKGNGNL